MLLGVGARLARDYFGSVSAAFAYLRGDRILVDRPIQSIAIAAPGDEVVLTYTVRNRSTDTVSLLGVSPSCTCTSVQNATGRLVSGAARQIAVKIKIDDDKTRLGGSVRVFTSSPQTPELELAYVVYVSGLAGREKLRSSEFPSHATR
jgi:hypothetical protein